MTDMLLAVIVSARRREISVIRDNRAPFRSLSGITRDYQRPTAH